jgi:hypothetical protein
MIQMSGVIYLQVIAWDGVIIIYYNTIWGIYLNVCIPHFTVIFIKVRKTYDPSA